ncbi:MAG: hypothetical protein V3V55_04310 [Rhodospirillales bacterium]
MRVLFYLGYALLAAAFFAGAAEIAAHGIGGTRSPVLSAYDTWYTLWPSSLIVSRIIIERDLAPFLWDPVLVTVLSLPAWMILGIPGAALAWFFHPKRHGDGVTKEELSKYEESLFLYDRLSEQAKAEGYVDDPPIGISAAAFGQELPPEWRTNGKEEPFGLSHVPELKDYADDLPAPKGGGRSPQASIVPDAEENAANTERITNGEPEDQAKDGG